MAETEKQNAKDQDEIDEEEEICFLSDGIYVESIYFENNLFSIF